MNQINVLIVEDEFLTADRIREHLEEIGYKVCGMARDAQEALFYLDRKEVDIAILDIQIQGDQDGTWLAKKIDETFGIPHIFLTANSDQSTVNQAMETKTFGYLVKPFTKLDLYTTIELALKNASTSKPKTGSANLPDENNAHLIDDYLFVKENLFYSKILLSDILYFQSELKYVEIHTEHKKFLIRSNVSDLLAILPKERFIQPHRSYILNKDKVDKIGPNFVEVSTREIPLSTSRKKEFSRQFKFL